ncbi:methyltransferase family protein [Idiomarina seosinensis]|uniref:Isoprenylcysteine carboxylmethyltransferase family protein n=1 Tax=Idiomarina seosinensis TaxID=281739 RepID=A0A432Z6T5_9GAMM|nr:isoprenylcysteine carboxylmethyltransferase family protein [Idiomarina seosinensis]RUO73596.1 isoprenylcysteine carboxylmethyltransferase family protein [Idiomarina seosinensis]
MKFLELKIPPVIVVAIIAILMWFVMLFTPQVSFSAVPLWTIAVIGFLGIVVPLLGVISFKRAQTTPDPRTPDKSSSLVTSGVYKYTRNPMYLGFLLLLFAWGLWLGNMAALLGLPLYMFYLNQFQIKPEERALTQLFGKQYTDYRKTANRWF